MRLLACKTEVGSGWGKQAGEGGGLDPPPPQKQGGQNCLDSYKFFVLTSVGGPSSVVERQIVALTTQVRFLGPTTDHFCFPDLGEGRSPHESRSATQSTLQTAGSLLAMLCRIVSHHAAAGCVARRGVRVCAFFLEVSQTVRITTSARRSDMCVV